MPKSIAEIFPEPPEDLNPEALDLSRVPAHVAVIMDGNGRWAKQRGNNRLAGHKAGINAVRETIRTANDVGVGFLTIYSFSSENWRRPADEVNGLMELFAKTMLAEVDGLHAERVRIKTIGQLDRLPRETRKAFEEAEERTKDNTGMTLVIAVNYGGREEILRAVKRLTESGGSANEISEADFSACLDTFFMPDPDLLIRTSGEMRVSNFLLWQIAYTEFYCSTCLWPDFDRYEFLRALLDYQGRNRRFGAV